MKYTAAAVQIAPLKAELPANLDRTAEAVLRCAEHGAELVVFPETSLTGYFLEGGVAEVAMPAEDVVQEMEVRLRDKLAGEVDVVIGFYEKSAGQIYNAAAHIAFAQGQSRLLHVHRKFFLPTYGVFDEERFVSRGREINAYETRFGRFSILICEDIWHSVTPAIAALKGALTIVALAASPARGFSGDNIENLDTYHRLITTMAQEHGVWVVNAMLVGFEGGKGFTGGSIIVDPFGRIIASGPVGEEHFLLAEIETDDVAVARQQTPLLADLASVIEDVAREMREVSEASCP